MFKVINHGENVRRRIVACVIALLAAGLILIHLAYAESAQQVFKSPEAAATALIAAAKNDDMKALGSILGGDAQQILSSGDAVADNNARENFVSKYQEMHRLAYDTDGRIILYLGAENWPVPIPLVKKDGGWAFDTASGKDELLYRRIGRNELYTIGVLEDLVDAQQEFASEVRDGSRVKHFAQKIISDQGKHNGLYWPPAPGEPESPIGPLIASAAAEGYKRNANGQPVPFHGYIYRILTGQGKNAQGGAKSYLVKGRMARGFAFLAYPVEYRSSGVMTFMVNQDGVLLQKDLGPGTAKIAQEMTRYNPDNSWEEAKQ